MRNLRYLALLVLAISVPTLIFAQSQGIVPCDGTDCTTGSVVTLANNILRFLIGISVLLATIMIAWGGFKMVTSAGNSGEVSKGREMMTNAIIGIIITLAAWLLIDTVMKLVLKDPDSWKSIIDDVGQNTPTPGQKPSGDGGGGGGEGGGGSNAGTNVPFDTFNLATSQSDASLNTNYANVSSKYARQIDSACAGSSIPNCTQVVTALIANESAGNPGAISGAGSVCIMQLNTANGGRTCSQSDASCIQNQINLGVQKLNGLYSNGSVDGYVPNMLAAYNGGEATSAGSSVSGKNPPLAASVDCPGLLAYQCTTNPGGLVETQHYVANICRTLSINGASCDS